MVEEGGESWWFSLAYRMLSTLLGECEQGGTEQMASAGPGNARGETDGRASSLHHQDLVCVLSRFSCV